MLGTIKVTYLDGTTVEGPTINADAIRFERQFKQPASRMFGKDDSGELEIYLEHLWFYGWCVAKREADAAEFDEWMDTVQSVDIVKAAEQVPTDPSPSPSP